MATTGKYAPKGMDDAAYGRMVAAIEYQRDHFADTPALIVPCYRFPEPRLDEEGLLASAQALGPAGTAHMTNTGTRFQALAEGSCVHPGVRNILLAARAPGLVANITIWHLMPEQEWKEALGIPEDMHTFAAVPVSRPAGRRATSVRSAVVPWRTSSTAIAGRTTHRPGSSGGPRRAVQLRPGERKFDTPTNDCHALNTSIRCAGFGPSAHPTRARGPFFSPTEQEQVCPDEQPSTQGHAHPS